MDNRKIVLVTGGTGTLGTEVVKQLKATNRYRVRVLTTKTHTETGAAEEIVTGNLASGEGLTAALNEVSIVIHCASSPLDAQYTDVEGTGNLLNAVDKKHFEHFIYISIVGIDETDYPYYQAKLQVEQLIQNSGLPYSILRTTQFYNFIKKMIQSMPVVDHQLLVPDGLSFQPIAITEVAARLAALTDEAPLGRLPNMGGPEVLSLEALTKTYLRVTGATAGIKLVQPSTPRELMFCSGINLVSGNRGGKMTWEEYLLQ